MTRVGKYLVYNPRKGKPTHYHETYIQAQAEAMRLNVITKEDILILKVVTNVENDIIKMTKSEHLNLHKRDLEIVED